MTLTDHARLVSWLLLFAAFAACVGCATVPKNQRRYLADRTMPAQDDPLEKNSMRKFHTTREGAAGGDGKTAGGGCGCSN